MIATPKLLSTITIAGLMSLNVACGEGMEPSGGRGTTAAATAPQESDATASGPEPEASESGEPAAPTVPPVSDDIDPKVVACRDQGALLDRRRGTCSAEYMVTDAFTCDRAGIRGAFANTGFQIDQILDRSIGREGFTGDVGDGYVIDQCGESADHRIVYLVKDDGEGGKLVREIEAKKQAAKSPTP